mmetsp:Transcript_584/g.1046  ORF Transcript_584/g.1046 Transcript_584/m.1046 type:complete len:810 (-) Transcript_584:3904-6333(-)
MKRNYDIILFLVFIRLANAFLTPALFSITLPCKYSDLVEKEYIRSSRSTHHKMSNIAVATLTSSPLDGGLSLKKSKKVMRNNHDWLLSYKSVDVHELDNLSVIQYASLINMWANIGDANKAEMILDRMLETSSVTNVFPNSYCFSGLMKAHIQSFRKRKLTYSHDGESLSDKCNEILNRMNELYDQTSQNEYKANTVIYNTLLNAYAEEMNVLLQKKSNKYTLMKPTYGESALQRVLKKNGTMYNAQKQIVSKAVGVVKRMEDGNGTNIPNPDVYTYCTIISLLAKCEDLEIAAMAHSYLPKVDKKCDTPTYNAVISAWANTGTLEGAMRATELLEDMERAFEEECTKGDSKVSIPNNFGPNSVTYFTVISAWVKCCHIGDNGFAAEKAESVLNKMVTKYESSILSEKERIYRFKPNVIAYSSVIDCWSKSGSGDAANHAKRLLQSMKAVGVDPNVYSYTSALTAFARSKSYEGALEASALLQEMKELYKETGDEAIKPAAVTYFAVIDAWARCESEEAGDRSEALIKEMEEQYRAGDHDMRPDVKFYARVIAAHVKSANHDSDKKARSVIRNMEKFCLTGDESYALAKPNIVCYNTVISSFARRRDAIGAFQLLNQMDQFTSRAAEEDKVIADEHSLNGVIYAISRSTLQGRAKKALKILERLDNSHINGDWKHGKPSTKSFNLVIATCSHSFKCSDQEKERALTIAFDVFSRLRASPISEPDRYTYISMLKTCGKLLPADSQHRKNLVETIFRCCCDDGLVDDSVLANFLLAAPQELVTAVLGDNVIANPSAAMLPPAWTQCTSENN